MTEPLRRSLLMGGLCLLSVLLCSAATARERLALHHEPIDLPGLPSAVVSGDVDGDGIRDLVVVVAYTEWDRIGISERSEMAGIDGWVEMMTVIPALLDRRELWVFPGAPTGGYEAASEPLPIDASVLSLEAGEDGSPVIALTDEGVSSVEYNPETGEIGLEPLLEVRSLLSGSETFLPNLGLLEDVDADGFPDLLVPTWEGADVYPGGADGFGKTPSAHLVYPRPEDERPTGRLRRNTIPELRDVSGDGLPDVLLPVSSEWRKFHLFLGAGGGSFAEPMTPLEEAEEIEETQEMDLAEAEGQESDDEEADADDEEGDDDEEDAEEEREPGPPEIVYFGDLDGDGLAEFVREEELDDEDAGFRKEMKEAKRPPRRYWLHRTDSDFRPMPEPYTKFDSTGYAFGSSSDIPLPGGFQDLDGDGLQDLVTMTLDFSLFQAVRIVALKSIRIGLDFHIWCQRADGGFKAVEGLDLSGKLRLNLENLRFGQLSQFAGDFDGDGRADFVQIGRGKTVTIHRGQEGCVYPAKADLSLALETAPQDLALVQVRDFDGDGLSDLLIIQPGDPASREETPPSRLDFYLSSEVSR